jgi:hypothetical protein
VAWQADRVVEVAAGEARAAAEDLAARREQGWERSSVREVRIIVTT